jgi:hypothetical protein
VNHFCLDHNALDLIEADLIAPAIVELGRARRGVVRHRCGLSAAPIREKESTMSPIRAQEPA